MFKTIQFIVLAALCLNLTAKAQSQNTPPLLKKQAILGKVSSATTAEALPNAAIKITTTNQTLISNDKGAFILTLDNGSYNLSVSYLGYKTSNIYIQIPLKEPLVISLQPDDNNLKEVEIVSTGYQNIPKERATGSFTLIDNKLYNQQVGSNVLSRLESIANGVSTFRNNGTKSSQLMVRGISTINGPSSPLIILDNFPYEGDINNLNPNDVESVTILKDAAAASIWGTKAGNGVIVITTKKGIFNQPLKIEANSNITIGTKPNLNYLTPMTSSDYIDYENLLHSKGYYNSQIASIQYPVLSPVIEILTRVAKGTLTQPQADQQINLLRGLDVRDDYSKYIYRSSRNQQSYINLRGGDEKLAYLFASGYDHNKSSLAEGFDKLNLRSEANFKPLKNLQLNAGLNYTASDSQSGKSAYGSISPSQPYQMLADANGIPLTVAQTYSQSFKDNTALNAQLLDWNYYPLTDYEHTTIKTNVQDIRANFSAQYQLFKGLSLDVKYQYERQQTTGKTLYDDQSYFARNLVNSYTQIAGTIVTNILPKGGILDQQNSTLSSNNIRGQLNFDRAWDKHNLTILVGEELSALRNTSNRFRTYGFNANILTSSGADYRTLYPNYVTKATSRIPYINSFSSTLNHFVSFYANGAYTYDRKYTLSGSVRRDASNLFGVATNDKWTPLWSAGLSWLLSEEQFFKLNAIPYLKLRATYGYSGNVDQNKSAVTTISYASANSLYTNSPYSTISNFSNPDLRWEKNRTINFGIDFRSKNNRITGSVDYFLKNATDLYGTVPVDYTVGIGIATITKNVAEMKGKGIDVEINTLNINNEVKWMSSLNFNYYRDKVKKYYLISTNGVNYVNDNMNPTEGHPVWSVFSYQWAGLDTFGNPQGYLSKLVSEDYTSITSNGTQLGDLIYNGPRFPAFYGSLGNTLNYKNFSLAARISYNFGNYFRRQSINYSSLATSGTGNSDYALRWQKTGDELHTNVPSIVYPLVSSRDNFYNASEVLVEKADCIRLQYITLSYDLSKQNYNWLPLKSVQLYINANNLGILWRANKRGIDPDYTFTNSVMPAAKNIAFGLRANL